MCKLSAVGSIPRYAAVGSFISCSSVPGIISCNMPRQRNSSTKFFIAYIYNKVYNQKTVQRYCFFWTYTNKQSEKMFSIKKEDAVAPSLNVYVMSNYFTTEPIMLYFTPSLMIKSWLFSIILLALVLTLMFSKPVSTGFASYTICAGTS